VNLARRLWVLQPAAIKPITTSSRLDHHFEALLKPAAAGSRGCSPSQLTLCLFGRLREPPWPRPCVQSRRETDRLTRARTTPPVRLATTTSDPHPLPLAGRTLRAPPPPSDLDLAARRQHCHDLRPIRASHRQTPLDQHLPRKRHASANPFAARQGTKASAGQLLGGTEDARHGLPSRAGARARSVMRVGFRVGVSSRLHPPVWKRNVRCD
jgi:hypothetical protein